MKTSKANLLELYQITSKHSNYQILPNLLKSILSETDLEVRSRFEAERFSFIQDYIKFDGKKILDIGANTGYFSFSALEAGAKSAKIIEGNEAHAAFVTAGADYLGVEINVENRYLEFIENDCINEKYDVTLLLNVVHHLGDDYGNRNITMEQAKELMKKSINYFKDLTNFLVFQMGFCWKGDRDLLLFKNGTKKEMIDFVNDAIDDIWTVEAIGIAQEYGHDTIYAPLNDNNINRFDKLGEFRNRPIFILKSMNY